MLKDRNVLLGVTGSIAAYKSVDIARRLIDEGASVKVVMTEAACRFITPYMFETVTGNPAHTDLFEDPFSHINLTKESHLFIVAPATANTINKLSCGIADNLITNLWLTHEGPVLMAPAMNFRMYRNPLVQKHIGELGELGVLFAGPVSGSLACGVIIVADHKGLARTHRQGGGYSWHRILRDALQSLEPYSQFDVIPGRGDIIA